MLIQRQTTISGNIVQLCTFLRSNGFVVGIKEESDAMKAIHSLPIGDKFLFRDGLKSIFC